MSLPIGGADLLDLGYLDKLAALAERIDRPGSRITCAGLAWRGLTPTTCCHCRLTEAVLAHVVDRIKAVQDRLGRPLILENPSSYLEFHAS